MMYKDQTFFREVEPNCFDVDARLAEMDAAGVDVQVLCTVPVMFSYWAKPADTLEVCKLLNDDLAASVARKPTRFVGLGTIPMQAPELAVQELRRCVRELGFAGVQIGSHINDWTLDAEDLFPVFQEAERLGACILIHPWDMVGKSLMEKYWLPWLVGMPAEVSLAICSVIFSSMLDRLPSLRIMFAHGGGSFPGTIGRIEHGWNVRPDLCAVDNCANPRSYMGKFWVDSLVHDKSMFKHVVNLFGANRMCCGSDYPFPLGELEGGKVYAAGRIIDESEFTEEEKEKMLSTNALEWLGVDAANFARNA